VAFNKKWIGLALSEYGQDSLPDHVQENYHRLTKAADWMLQQSWKFSLPQWKIFAFKDNTLNAFSAAGGEVLISHHFWRDKSTFTQNEIAAILAHEVAHVVLNHGQQRGCMALEHAGANPDTIEGAVDLISNEAAYGLRSVYSERRSEVYQLNEYQADEYAVKLLRLIGEDPMLMARALEKLMQGTQAGISISNSHPETLSRIERAKTAAGEGQGIALSALAR
jgi:predicted Zn-dependent protease